MKWNLSYAVLIVSSILFSHTLASGDSFEDVFISMDVKTGRVGSAGCNQIDEGITKAEAKNRSSSGHRIYGDSAAVYVEIFADNLSQKNLSIKEIEIMFDFHIGLLSMRNTSYANNRSNIFGKSHIKGRYSRLYEPFRQNLERHNYVFCFSFRPRQIVNDIEFTIGIEYAVFHTEGINGAQVDTVRKADVLTLNKQPLPTLDPENATEIQILLLKELEETRKLLEKAKLGDLNLDGHVNIADFLIFVENFGQTTR